MLSETCLTEKINDSEVHIDGYNLLRMDSHSRFTGGVAIYIKDCVKFSVISSECYDKNVWMLAIQVSSVIKSGLYIVLYHSPNASHKLFIEYLNTWIEKNVNFCEFVMLVGDFNIDLLKNTTYSRKMKQVIKSFGLKQHVKTPTRITATSKTIIDFVITNYQDIETEICDVHRISDHAIIRVCNINSEKPKQCIKTYHKYSKLKFIEMLKEVNWKEISKMNFETMCEQFISEIKKCVLNMNVTTTVRYNNINNSFKWFNNDLRILRDKSRTHLQKAKLTNLVSDWNDYKIARNLYSSKLNKIKNSYDKNKIENSKTSKDMWKNLKIIISSKSRVIDSCIEFPWGKCDNEVDIAENLNQYFVKSIEEINVSIPMITHSVFESLSSSTNDCFIFKQVTPTILLKTINSIKFKNDSENININTIKDALDIVDTVFCDLVNQSFDVGKFPENWKNSTIIPVKKKAKSIKCSDQRPINTLPTYEKVIEHLTKNQLQNYLDERNIITKEQSGFRENHSCETALNLVIANWKQALDDKKVIVAVFLDLSRAFETLDRRRLLMKLQHYGIQGKELNWFKSYLTNRTQQVRYGSATSTEILNNLGVPQGSVLGPLLFILYINDIIKSIKECSICLFADDALLYVCADSLSEAVNKVNLDMNRLDEWLNVNNLKLNGDKTFFMLLGQRNVQDVPEIKIGKDTIQQIHEIKYLGVIIDEQLNFKSNCQYVLKKMSKKISFLGRIKKKLSIAHRIKVYMSIVSPHIEYCSSVLFMLKDADFKKLQILQNRGMRIILGCNRRTKRKDMLDVLNWMSIKQRIVFNTLVLIFKIKNGLLPSYLQNNIKLVKDETKRLLRNGNDFKVKYCAKSGTRNSLYYKGLTLFNSLNLEAKNAKTIQCFKREIVPYIKNTFKL